MRRFRVRSPAPITMKAAAALVLCSWIPCRHRPEIALLDDGRAAFVSTSQRVWRCVGSVSRDEASALSVSRHTFAGKWSPRPFGSRGGGRSFRLGQIVRGRQCSVSFSRVTSRVFGGGPFRPFGGRRGPSWLRRDRRRRRGLFSRPDNSWSRKRWPWRAWPDRST